MYSAVALASLSLFAAVRGQQVGTNTAETHPKLTVSKCTKAGGCTTSGQSIVLDANWRWLHTTTGYTNCYNGNSFDKTLCPDGVTCAKNCAVDGADYSGTYGISTSGNSLTLKFVTKGSGTNVGSRVYLLNPDDTTYQLFKLKNKEFTFDVDVSGLPCGLNGALYFSEMAGDGGKSKEPNNAAGSKYGTGYCDAQCPRDMKFIKGEGNVAGWTGSPDDPNSGKGGYGTCCTEMDIWEANSQATAYTPHPCDGTGLYRCTAGADCDGVCDQPGCDFNSYRMGNTSYYGPGQIVDTKSKFTVVTQFITADGTDTGALTDIRRIYVQNGKVIYNSYSNIAGVDPANSITEKFCAQQKAAFSDTNVFQQKGGYSKLGDAFANGVVLVMSIWDDHTANMLWLDSAYPTDQPASKPGITRGPCSTSSGKPTDVEANSPNAQVVFSNIKFGDIDSTYPAGGNPPPPPPVSSVRSSAAPASSSRPASSSSSSVRPASSSARPTTTTTTTTIRTTSTSSARPATSTPAGCVAQKYAQCGGLNYSGCKTCAAGSTCKYSNDWYSQCL